MSDDEPYSIHRQAGMDEADAVTALLKMDRENRIAALRRLAAEIGTKEFFEIIENGQDESVIELPNQ